VCWLLEPGGWLFTGDHIMAGSTVVIAPPDGNMNAYLASLERLKALPVRRIAPGHGGVLEDPVAVVDGIVAHRLRREAKVVAALQSRPSATADALLGQVYADTPAWLHPLARLSLQAHLEKLVEDRRARVDAAGRFSLRLD
jgi:glyoxylase-like metal-dependent hydrolase (beta-lactamase superfamily II)